MARYSGKKGLIKGLVQFVVVVIGGALLTWIQSQLGDMTVGDLVDKVLNQYVGAAGIAALLAMLINYIKVRFLKND